MCNWLMVVAMLSLSLYHIGLQLNYRAYTEEVMDFYNKLYLGANNFFVSEGGWFGCGVGGGGRSGAQQKFPKTIQPLP